MRYEKGRKVATRRRIMDVASERFRRDGIAASGLAGIMSEAGLTNGAFYPHFKSKTELVRESVVAAMEDQMSLMQDLATNGGLETAIATYLSAEHRDNPATGCTLAALLPELARQPLETRNVFAERLLATAGGLASALPPYLQDKERVAMALYAMLIGTLQLARTVEGTDLSDRILAAGADAARVLAHVEPAGGA